MFYSNNGTLQGFFTMTVSTQTMNSGTGKLFVITAKNNTNTLVSFTGIGGNTNGTGTGGWITDSGVFNATNVYLAFYNNQGFSLTTFCQIYKVS